MATKIVTKNSSTASAVPTASDLVQGELAVNVADKRLFTEDNAGAIVELGTNPTTLNVNGAATMDGLTVDGRTDLRGGATPLGVYRTLALAVDTQSEIVLGSQDLSNNYVDAVKIRGLLKANKTDGELSFYTLSSSTLTPRLNIASNGDISFYEDTGTTPKFFWDASAESLGIGTSSIAAGTKLQVAGETRIYPDSGTGVLRFGSGGAEKGKLSVDTSSNMMFETAGSERMRIDSAGNIKQNSVNTSTNVGYSVNNGTYDAIALGTGGFGVNGGAATDGGIRAYNNLLFGTGASATERVRIDSAGNLLVGTTDTFVGDNASGNGLSFRASAGDLGVAASNTPATYFNRMGSDGAISDFRKSGASVGNIGVFVGYSYFGNSGTQSNGIIFTPNAIEPFNSSTAASDKDGDIDLGANNQRFKNLYLSGGVYLGGTGAANKLDDYEEGTWTPTVNGVSGTLFKNSYIKVGNQITVTAFFSSVSWNAGANTVDNLPFTNGYGHASIYSPSSTVVIQQATVDGTQIKFRAATSGSSTYLLVSATYIQD